MKITSPIPRYQGTVTLPDALNFTQYAAWEGVFSGADFAGETYTLQAHRLIPALCGIVQAWELTNIPANVTPETFPATPPKDVQRLLGWLVASIAQLINGDADPNA
jgi:hypothetical protein